MVETYRQREGKGEGKRREGKRERGRARLRESKRHKLVYMDARIPVLTHVCTHAN